MASIKRVLVLFSLFFSVLEGKKCRDAPRCTCDAYMVRCRSTGNFPGALSLSSYPLKTYSLSTADLKHCYVYPTELSAFVDSFATSLLKLDIRRAANEYDCTFLSGLKERYPALIVLSDCQTPLTTHPGKFQYQLLIKQWK